MKRLTNYNVKESVFPFNKFDGVDLILGPEMKSTGEVMGIDDNFLKDNNILVKTINKVKEGSPHIVDSLLNNEINLVINTTKTQGSIRDSYSIRRTALMINIPYYTTIAGAKVAVNAIENLKNHALTVKSLQALH